MVCFKFATVALLKIAESQTNLRGRCAWGHPCDNNRISYGCEKMTDLVGVCWSECVGYLPKVTGEGVFIYEGWCYNTNNTLAPGMDFSGKIARSRKRRARMSNEQLEALREKEAEDIDESEEDDNPFLEVSQGTLMGRPLDLYQTCTEDKDCASVSRACSIGCSNEKEATIEY